jgi:membrane protein DedA with SNARE-associated domain
MREFLNHYGLWAAFLLALIENDVAFIAIGVVVKLGDGDPLTPDDLNIYTAIPAAILGAIIHDSFWFAIGHLHSEWFKSSRVYQRVGPVVERLAHRFGPWEIFVARFIYGTRNPSSIFWGIHKLRYTKFASIELLSLVVWGSVLVGVGYHSTHWALKLIGKVEHHHRMQWLVGAVLIASIVMAGLRVFSRKGIVKIEEKIEQRELAEETEGEGAKSPADIETR